MYPSVIGPFCNDPFLCSRQSQKSCINDPLYFFLWFAFLASVKDSPCLFEHVVLLPWIVRAHWRESSCLLGGAPGICQKERRRKIKDLTTSQECSLEFKLVVHRKIEAFSFFFGGGGGGWNVNLNEKAHRKCGNTRKITSGELCFADPHTLEVFQCPWLVALQ